MTGLLYFLFFCSGLSGLIYQVVWVRVFGNVFGNTIQSASLVVAVFMLGLGVGGVAVGIWADRRYAASPNSLLRTYASFELAIGLLGLGISILLPSLGLISAFVSAYSQDPSGWYVVSAASHIGRSTIAVVLLTPITLLMGGTLTLLIRHLVRDDVSVGGWRIALLYGVNTLGAAGGAFLTDFALVPAVGLRATQIIAVALNFGAGAGAFVLAFRAGKNVRGVRLKADKLRPARDHKAAVPLTSVALAMAGFAAMGMEILWFRHFSILLGGFRAVFSLLLTIILIGIGAGACVSGVLLRRTHRPVEWLIVAQGLFVGFVLLGLAASDSRRIEAVVLTDPGYQAAIGSTLDTVVRSEWARTIGELWFNAKPMLLEIGPAVLLMGFSFPLANAAIQRAERSVGRRAGVLYLSNTIGAVCGSLAAGFLLLPAFGIQGSATILMTVALLAVIPLYFAGPSATAPDLAQPDHHGGHRGSIRKKQVESLILERAERFARPAAAIGSFLVGGAAIALWLLLLSDHVITRALASSTSHDRVLSVREGLTEVVEVTEIPEGGRRLVTNGHPMSATTRMSQRYMRALAHIPLLAMDKPEAVLVIGFGVGNTTQAATLHPSIRRVEVADLSRDILASAGYFTEANRDVLRDPRVVVYVNDGRQHLQMQAPSSYDLITLEPPPIGYAGVASLYSTEFYTLARTRLKPEGYISQWLPAYQVPGATTLAMVRAFIDVFPQAVLTSGAEADLLLIGVNGSHLEIDPRQVTNALARDSALKVELDRLDLGSVRDLVGTFVGSSQKLATATRDSAPVTDDRPVQEYGVRSLLNQGEAVPASVVDLTEVSSWCPKCFVDGRPVPLAEGLDTYLALLGRAYAAPASEILRARRATERPNRVIAGSAYLGAVVPESGEVHNILGIAFAQRGRLDAAIVEFREALRLDPSSAETHWHLGAALASRGARVEATDHLRRSVQLDPTNPLARHDLEIVLALDGRR